MGPPTATGCDVVVSDLRMPRMDGATFLKQVRDRWPGTVRLVLSGHADQATAIRAASVAHQFLSKPCAPELLEQTIARVGGLRRAVDSKAVRETVGAIGGLPARPALSDEIVRCVDREDTNVGDLARIVERDVGMSTNVLHLCKHAAPEAGQLLADEVGGRPRSC